MPESTRREESGLVEPNGGEQKNRPDEWSCAPVRQWVTVFTHVLYSEIDSESLAKSVVVAGAIPEQMRRPELYFEPPVIELTQSRTRLEPLEISTSSEQRVRIEPFLQLFPFGMAAIVLRCEPADGSPWKLVDLMRFNENYRYTQPRGWQKNRPRFRFAVSNGPSIGLQDREPVHMWELLAALAKRYGLSHAKPVYETFGKMHLCCFASLERELSEADRYHFALVDNPPDQPDSAIDPLPSPKFVQQALKEALYERWIHQGQYFAFTGHSFFNWLEPSAQRSIGGEQLFGYWERTYVPIATVLLFQRAALTRFSRRAAEIEEKYRRSDKKLAAKVLELRRDLLDFSNRSWFARITYEIQGAELAELGRRTLGLDQLYMDAREKLSEFEEYLSRREQDRIGAALLQLQWVVIAAGFVGLTVASLQFEQVRGVLRESLETWLGPGISGWAWPAVALLAMVFAACGFASFVVWLLLWVRAWWRQ